MQHAPSRAELNDVVSTLLMKTDGLVVVGKTTIENHPAGEVNMIRTLMEHCASESRISHFLQF